ncbi:glycosyl transferase family protein [Lutimaribacter marinistellae]|uniref:Glycosyl transferase family protein n=1 Tax=Lutimaribacter marinistellae TaxID=1820329 RepID=A0ABV7TCC2_9RHOB
MSLAEYVRILGRGPGRSRSLTRGEAQESMRLILSGHAAPEAIGALLMLLRMKGETAAEIAGFADSAAAVSPALPAIDLDWPSYAAGRTRGQPWFLLSAKLVAQAGHRVLLHGWNGGDPKVRAGLADAGIGFAKSVDETAHLLDRDGIAYLPLEYLHPRLFRLLNLRDVLGLRSCINTVCRMLNPARAGASVQGVFHPSYRLLQAEAAELRGWSSLSVIKGAGGEFERNPAKELAVFGLRDGRVWDATLPALRRETLRLAEASDRSLPDLWAGASTTGFEATLVTATAALALDTLGHRDSDVLANDLWTHRRSRPAA